MAEDLVLSEAEELLGARWSRKPDSTLRRGGYTNSRIFVGGEPVHIERPRVRDIATQTEHPLKAISALRSRDALDEDVKRLVVRGVTTRNYDDALGHLSDGLGLKKSAVSESLPASIAEGPGRLERPFIGGLERLRDLHRWRRFRRNDVHRGSRSHERRGEEDPRAP